MRGQPEQARLQQLRQQQEERAREEANFKASSRGQAAGAPAHIQPACTCRSATQAICNTWLVPPDPSPPPVQARPLNKAVLAKPLPAGPSSAPLTLPVGVQLRSDARASQRAQFDAQAAAKQQELEVQRQQREREEQQREQEELREYRRGLQPQTTALPDFYGVQ